MAATLRVRVESLAGPALDRVRKEIAQQGRNRGPYAQQLIRDVGRFEAQQQGQTFASEGAKSGGRWRALSPKYAAWKARVRPNRKILQFDGNLRRSLVNMSDRFHLAFIRSGTLFLGSRHPLAVTHDQGSTKTITVPAHLVKAHTRNTRRGTVQVQAHARGPYSQRQNLPARPLARKSEAQRDQLRLAVIHVFVRRLAQVAGAQSPVGQRLAQIAVRLRKPNPRK